MTPIPMMNKKRRVVTMAATTKLTSWRRNLITCINFFDTVDFRYDQFQERKAEMNAKFRAKRAREEVEEWDGLDASKGDNGHVSNSDSDSGSDSEEDPHNPVDSLLTSLTPRLDSLSKGKLSNRAALFFDQPEF